ncbi:MAG: isoprenylcysteine carboxylmethyltransferase family protein [Cyclobacteriaceae bacterium]|nr:isoprenylcysteine carboxylmethyltransferase family protein [Cyclobacteriaceae bacterium]
MSYALLIAGWTLFGLLHSVLASQTIKKFFAGMGLNPQGYRLAYVLISTVTTLGMLLGNGMISSQPFFNSSGIVRYFSLVLATFGVLVIRAAFRQYRLFAFLGLAEEHDAFVTSGILGKVRHPLYSGTLLIVLGFFLFSPNPPTLVSALCVTIYTLIGMKLEERRLIARLGDTYREYQKRVPALIPRFL